ncbi:hypothetical protein D3C87_1832730 [compost metagenome]
MLLQYVPAKPRILTAVGGLILDQNAFISDVPELARDIRKDRRLCPSGGGHSVIARMASCRRVQKCRRVTNAAADQQRNGLLRRNTTGGVNRWDHRVPGKNHRIKLLVMTIIVLCQP